MHFWTFLALLIINGLISVENYKIIWDNDMYVDLNDIDEGYGKSDEQRLPNYFLIYPGTKWCGAGNIAESDVDLGPERETDKCCRAHDMCPDIIEGHQTKNNLTNPTFYTRLNCDCDVAFYKCLKSVTTRTASKVGHIYFTMLNTKCYKYDHPIIGCSKFTYFPARKCIAYILNRGADKLYQWFDVPNF